MPVSEFASGVFNAGTISSSWQIVETLNESGVYVAMFTATALGATDQVDAVWGTENDAQTVFSDFPSPPLEMTEPVDPGPNGAAGYALVPLVLAEDQTAFLYMRQPADTTPVNVGYIINRIS